MASRNVMVFCGGPSTEHEISLLSARGVVEELSKKHEVHVVAITRSGYWHYFPPNDPFCTSGTDPRELKMKDGKSCHWVPLPQPEGGLHLGDEVMSPDICFPIIHSTLGEDGKIHTLFEMTGLPYVGVGVEGATVSLNKDFTKRILAHSGIKVVPFETAYAHQSVAERAEVAKKAAQSWGYPLYVKPATQGSSVGIRRAESEIDLLTAIDEGLGMDKILVIEKEVKGREFEVSVLGHRKLIVSHPGEISYEEGDFYTYENKYVHPEKVEIINKADVDTGLVSQIQQTARKVFRLLNCEGIARVDFLYDSEKGELYVNEPNTMPGFTPISMYPKMLDASGLKYSDLLDQLLDAAVEAFEDRTKRQKAVLAWRP